MRHGSVIDVASLIILTAAATAVLRIAMAPAGDLSWPLLWLSLFAMCASLTWLIWSWLGQRGANMATGEVTAAHAKGTRILTAVLAVASIGVVSFVGQSLTVPNLPWYATLQKPVFTPPNWLFSPVWITLYLLMAFSAWRIASLPIQARGRTLALFLFAVQLALNLAWSWMFFELRNPLLGLSNIVPQLAFVIATIVAFARLDRVAAWCIAPLGPWVAYAAALNFSFWWLNR